ncbi:hypothetical protein C8R44DRAFT_740118 [Mycena epipterygia]|nr:hypothetical protein C8R44DRAFT_740118 [Mycena epipterygia]
MKAAFASELQVASASGIRPDCLHRPLGVDLAAVPYRKEPRRRGRRLLVLVQDGHAKTFPRDAYMSACNSAGTGCPDPIKDTPLLGTTSVLLGDGDAMQGLAAARIRYTEVFAYGRQAPVKRVVGRVLRVGDHLIRREIGLGERQNGGRRGYLSLHDSRYRSLYPKQRMWGSYEFPAFEPSELTAPYREYRNNNVCDAFVEEDRMRVAFLDQYPALYPCPARENETEEFQKALRFYLARLGACDGVLHIREHIRVRDWDEAIWFEAAAFELMQDEFLQAWGCEQLPRPEPEPFSWPDNDNGVWQPNHDANGGWGPDCLWPNYPPIPYPPMGSWGVMLTRRTRFVLRRIVKKRCGQGMRLRRGQLRSMGGPFLQKCRRSLHPALRHSRRPTLRRNI